MGLDKIVQSLALPLTRLHILVYGRVQGVGYRGFTRRGAEELGLSGWVRNLEGGAVELEAEGTKEALDALAKKLRSGHPYASVEKVEIKTISPLEGPRSFDIID